MGNVGGIGFLMIAIWAKLDFEILLKWSIDFNFGLPLNINRNEGQNKFEVQHGQLSAQNRPERHLSPNFE